MIKPFKGDFPLTQGWGENPAIYAKFGLKGHNGLDYGLPTGTPVIAPHNGKVIEAAFDANGYGMYVKIENNKEGSVIGHLKSFNVNPGDTILVGQQFGISDNTGFSTGPHLHWGYYLFPRNRNDGYLGFINQLPLINNPPTESIDDLKRKIEDLKQTEIRLTNEKKALQIEMTTKLAECKAKCYQEFKIKVTEIIKNL